MNETASNACVDGTSSPRPPGPRTRLARAPAWVREFLKELGTEIEP